MVLTGEGPRGEPGGAVVSTRTAVVVTVALIGVANVVRSLVVPGRFHLWFNLGVGLVVVAVAMGSRVSARELGLARSSIGSGLRWGAGAFAAIAGVLLVVAVVPATSSVLDDDRTAISGAQLLWRALVVIPFGTVLVEELVFRGVLLGLLQRLMSARRALIASAVVFGLWHLLPVWRGGGAGDLSGGGGDAGRAGAVAATFAATTIAGLGFGWLRQRSGSLIAPIAAHLATNSVTLAAAWAVAR